MARFVKLHERATGREQWVNLDLVVRIEWNETYHKSTLFVSNPPYIHSEFMAVRERPEDFT